MQPVAVPLPRLATVDGATESGRAGGGQQRPVGSHRDLMNIDVDIDQRSPRTTGIAAGDATDVNIDQHGAVVSGH